MFTKAPAEGIPLGETAIADRWLDASFGEIT